MSEEKTADSLLARQMVIPLYGDQKLFTGESRLAHADGMANIVRGIRDDEELISACYLFAVHDCLPNPDEWLRNNFGAGVAELVNELHRLIELNGKTRLMPAEDDEKVADKLMLKAQDALLRKMVLAMCRDLRVVILRLSSRLQTLRYYAMKKDDPEGARAYGADTLALYAPLANRLGIWQIKWELEDLSLRFTKPDIYNEIARQLDESREARLAFMRDAVDKIKQMLSDKGIEAEVSGRPKHIYSIYKKMERKHLRFDQLYDVRALRIIVQTVEQCYEVLSIVQENFSGVSSEYDDYIANPKPNGYRSLHTVILDTRNRPIEIQIRTRQMHEYNELGMAAHWRYKEAGNSEKSTQSAEDQKVAWLRQLLAWSSDVKPEGPKEGVEDEHVYVLTPQGRVVEMQTGATPIDFAYHLHSELGHRCRSARVNGNMVPLNYKLKTGETVEIVAAKTGGPSRDWLNPELGFVVTNRARSKVRQWFHQQALQEQINTGRDIIEKDLARLGKTAFKLEELAKRLGYETVDDLFVGAAKEEFGFKSIEKALKPQEEEKKEGIFTSKSKAEHAKSQVLVVGVDSLLTQLARCCHPAPPDKIVGFVTRGRGVTIHRADCPNVRHLDEKGQERLIEVSWGNAEGAVFPVEVLVVGQNLPGLLKDMSEIFMKEKIAIVGMNSQIIRGDMHWRFNVEITEAEALKRTIRAIQDLPGVYNARRV